MTALDLTGARWRKSSHSTDKANCVEVAFVKSSHSTDTSNCVEVAVGPTAVAVRDSKAPDGGTLLLTTRAWAAFTAALRAREFAR
jgi:hypothetical protein